MIQGIVACPICQGNVRPVAEEQLGQLRAALLTGQDQSSPERRRGVEPGSGHLRAEYVETHWPTLSQPGMLS